MFVSKKAFQAVVAQRDEAWREAHQCKSDRWDEWRLISAYIEELTGKSWGYSGNLAADLKIREDGRERKEALARVEVGMVEDN